MTTTGTNSERVPRSRSIGIKPLLAAVVIAELVIWASLRSGVWQRTGLGWLFWVVNAALAVLVVLVPLGGWHWARQRFRMSLKTLLAATLVIGAALGGLAVFIERSRVQREAAAALRARGIEIGYAGADEPGLHALIGVEYFESPSFLGTFAQLDDADWKHVEQLTGLEFINCQRATDADLAHLRNLRQLNSLFLLNTRVTGEGLAHLGDLPRLTDLTLAGSKITDRGLAGIAACKRLTWLNLNSTAVGDAGLRHVSELKQLQILYLDRTLVTDAGLRHVAQLKRLRELHLDRTPVTDAGLAHLQSLPKLRELGLTGTSTTDAGLELLKTMPGLRRLRLEGCPGISGEGVEHFTDERPDVVVTH